jgi:(E)-4-hydroxy-3-methylbut-2-enyl-diphosphate synthase
MVEQIGKQNFSVDFIRKTSFSLLQGARMRNTKTEFVSCPSCGRTLFDLQETTANIQEATGHLPGVTIAVMGCIVNGPGEMADADFGYVGTLPGKVDLYYGKEVVRKGIPNEDAVGQLIELIKEYDMWKDKEEAPEEETVAVA